MPYNNFDDYLLTLKSFPNGLRDFRDNLDVLNTLNADRVQRNRRRDKRRHEADQNAQDDNGNRSEAEISEDEDDFLTPIINSLKEMADSQSSGHRDPLQDEDPRSDQQTGETERPHRNAIVGFTDEGAARQTEIGMKDNSFPKALFNMAINRKSPPLTLFSHESLERIRYGRNVEYPKCPTDDKPSLRLLKTDNFPDEEKIDAVSFLMVYPAFMRFLDVLLDGKAPRIFQGFCEHFAKISSCDDFQNNFAAYRTFDREIRWDFFHSESGFIIEVNSVEWSSRLLNCKATAMIAAPLPSGPSQSFRNQGRERPQPYFYPTQSFRFQKTPMLCLRCGDFGHRANFCEAKSPSKPGQIWIVKWHNGSLICITDNKPVCVNFNLDKGCSNNSTVHRTYNAHICTLCADPSHGASRCSRN